MRNNARRENLNRLRAQQSRDNDWFFDKWEKDFDRTAKRTMRGIVAVWAAGIILSLVFLGVVIWGIIELVQWVTAQ